MNDRGLKVLEQYELEIFSTRRGRGSYLCETSQGLKLLCDFQGSEKKLAFQNRILRELKTAGYENVDPALENREGKLVSVDREENRYILKDWFYGRECSPASEKDVLEAVENLARLHRYFCFPREEKEYCGTLLQTELATRTRELKKVRSFVRRRENRHSFEQMFLNSFSDFYEQACQAEELAKAVCSEEMLEEQIGIGTLCHGDYNYHHVLFPDSSMAVTNFEKCRFDYQVYDLYQFMRKILEKRNWDPVLGEKMLCTYERIRSLSRTEHRILYVKMAYPEKFWKLANHYYGGRKAWIPVRYEQKLEVLNGQREQKNYFLKLLE